MPDDGAVAAGGRKVLMYAGVVEGEVEVGGAAPEGSSDVTGRTPYREVTRVLGLEFPTRGLVPVAPARGLLRSPEDEKSGRMPWGG